MKYYLNVAIGALLGLLLLEGGLRLLPVNSGIRLERSDAAHPYTRYVPQQNYIYSHGWAFLNHRHGSVNKQGFANSRDFGGPGGTLVLGDSFIEAFSLPYAETLQGQLEQALGGRVYAAAASGNRLADTVELLRHFGPRLQPSTVVVFVKPFELSQLLAPAARGHSAFVSGPDGLHIVHTPYVESRLKQLLLHSALIRYTYYNLKLPDWISGAVQRLRNTEVEPVATDAAPVLEYYFRALRQAAPDPATRIVMLIDGDRASLYAGHASQTVLQQQADVALFVQLAHAHGLATVDMAPVFAQHWARYHERMDSLPADGHWNRVGHRLAAQAVLPLLSRGGNNPAL